MIALDTNLIVRFLTDDDPAAAARARNLIAERRTYVGVTVVLETAWVLSKAYQWTRGEAASALVRFFGLPNVTVEAREAVGLALGWAREGMDFADALHLALAGEQEAFATFDRDLIRQARDRGAKAVEP